MGKRLIDIGYFDLTQQAYLSWGINNRFTISPSDKRCGKSLLFLEG
jgi:hypothetical protein